MVPHGLKPVVPFNTPILLLRKSDIGVTSFAEHSPPVCLLQDEGTLLVQLEPDSISLHGKLLICALIDKMP